MSDKKQKNKGKNEKGELLNIIITVVTAFIIVTLICSAIVMKKSDKKDETPAVAPQNGTNLQPTAYDYIDSYESSASGTVSKDSSKTLAHFQSHYQDDYYRVNERKESYVEEGEYMEYYYTETVAYSKDGYIYRKECQSSYEEQDDMNSIAYLYTPTNSYIIYPGMNSYFKGDGNTQNYENTINFPVEQFETGTVNINGFEYYYEQYTDTNGITYKYCFDKNDELKYRIFLSPTKTVTERYMEYSKDVDYSLFEIPADYKLVE